MIKYRIEVDFIDIGLLNYKSSVWFKYIGSKVVNDQYVEAEVYTNIQINLDEINEDNVLEYIKENIDVEKIEKEIEQKLNSFENKN